MTADKMTDRGRPMTTQADTAHAPILPGADDYEAFLRAKAALAPLAGFEVADGEINPLLLPHQRAIVRWACRPGFRQINLATARINLATAGGYTDDTTDIRTGDGD